MYEETPLKSTKAKSTSSSSEDTNGDDNTSDSNNPSQSPSPPARKLEESKEDIVLKDKEGEVRGKETNVGGAAVKENWSKEIESKEAKEREVRFMSGQDSDCFESKIEEKEQEVTKEEKQVVTNEEAGDQKEEEEGEEDGVDVNENMLGSEKEAARGEDLASVDPSKVFSLSVISLF